MTQDSNRGPYVPWGEPIRAANQTAWWTELATVPALVKHMVVMFVTMAMVTTVNLIVNPGTWWSLALLVIWVAVILIHGLGIVSMGFLLDAEEPRRAPPPNVKDEPAHGTTSSWVPHRPDDQRAEAPDQRERQDEVLSSWPETPSRRPQAPEELGAEQGSWRAVTDIAWLRQSRNGSENGASDRSAVARDREASS